MSVSVVASVGVVETRDCCESLRRPSGFRLCCSDDEFDSRTVELSISRQIGSCVCLARTSEWSHGWGKKNKKCRKMPKVVMYATPNKTQCGVEFHVKSNLTVCCRKSEDVDRVLGGPECWTNSLRPSRGYIHWCPGEGRRRIARQDVGLFSLRSR